MIDLKKLDNIFDECYKRLFKESEPSGDIEKIKKSGEGKMGDFFMAYYLDQDRQDQIIEDVFKDLKVPKKHQGGIRTGIVLGAAPSGNKEATLKHRENYDKRLKEFLEHRNHAEVKG